jgi:uncharacterized protein YndB with AHSA1/START domain
MPDSPIAADAVLQDEQGRSILRFERPLRHSPERVWEALTERGELSSWHPSPFELERFVGGAVTYLPVDDAPEMPPGEVREYDPPRVLAYTWDADLLRWELERRDDGCLLVLTHTFDDRFKAARDAAGWHLCLIALDAALEGRKAPGASDGERIPEGWPELNSAYERRFGIPHERATPPPEP